MKHLKLFLAFLAVWLLASCTSIRVATDYDSSVGFENFKTYAFLSKGIDAAKISDLDKKRILKAIDQEMALKGFVKNQTPELLINISVTSKERVYADGFYGSGFWGWGGWGLNPFMWGGGSYLRSYTEGVLYVDVLKASSKELIWQGKASGFLKGTRKKKEAKIREFVEKILEDFPPQKER